jgi:uncharacterized protein YciI
MFVVTLTYIADLTEIDAARDDHMAYLAEGYAAGAFLASGRQEPRVGGVILAQAKDRSELDAWIAKDPFHARGLATYDVVEFLPSQTAPGLEALLA